MECNSQNIDGLRGAYEEALVGIKISDTSKPIEVFKSFTLF